MNKDKAVTGAELGELFSRTFSAVVFTLVPGGGGYELHVVSGQDNATSEDDYVKIASCAIALGAVAESMEPAELFAIASNIGGGGSIQTGLLAVDPEDEEEEEGPLDLASFFRMQVRGSA